MTGILGEMGLVLRYQEKTKMSFLCVLSLVQLGAYFRVTTVYVERKE